MSTLSSVTKIHVIAPLAATYLEEDGRFATDFLAWKDLLTLSEHDTQSEDVHFVSSWLAAADLTSGQRLKFSNPRAQRLLVSATVADGVSVVPEDCLKMKFVLKVAETSFQATVDDIVIIIICRHGSQGTGDIAVGVDGELLTKVDLEDAVAAMQVRQDCLFVISTACFSGLWTSDRWTLLSGAEAQQESVSMPASGSGENFPYAEQASGHGLVRPHSVMNPAAGKILLAPEDGMVVPPHAFSGMQNARHTLPEALSWIADMCGTVGSVSYAPLPCLPFRPFLADYADRLIVVLANPNGNCCCTIEERDKSARRGSQRRSSVLRPPLPVLSLDETAELTALAQLFNATLRVSTGTSGPAIRLSTKVVSSAALSPETQWRALRLFRSWASECWRSNAVTTHMGWESPRPAERWGKPHGIKETQEAEAAGARIYAEFLPAPARGTWSLVPGAWLADAWTRRGAVAEEDWAAAVRHAYYILMVVTTNEKKEGKAVGKEQSMKWRKGKNAYEEEDKGEEGDGDEDDRTTVNGSLPFGCH
ncbi:hypothetical protein K438DRAFT_1969949 [Mycena galopus ATCC 62051]|nr:hypothetical protein K438DRAFT_1969949 [Mycena galopus ATCC 62051]